MDWSDPVVLLALGLSAAVTGLAKGGLAGLGVLSVPIMAFAIPPVQAAAILLPLLILSDIVSLWTWWGQWSGRTLLHMLPGAVAGIGVGWATAAFVSDAMIKLIIGVIAVVFAARWAWGQWHRTAPPPRAPDPVRATGWAGLAGYTSFVAHAGGPPFSVYTLPLGLDPKVLTATSVAFFAVVNAVKLIPYVALGQFDATNLAASAWLAPVGIAFTLMGAAIIRRMRAEVFYPFTYALTALAGANLVYDGLAAL